MKGQSERVSLKALGIIGLILLTSAIGAVLEALHYVRAGFSRLRLRRR